MKDQMASTKRREGTEFKTAKKPCKHCGGLQRYASFGGCPCRLAAYLANRRAIRPYAAENIWLSDWANVRRGREAKLAQECGVYTSYIWSLKSGVHRILPHTRQDLLKGMAAVEAAEGGVA